MTVWQFAREVTVVAPGWHATQTEFLVRTGWQAFTVLGDEVPPWELTGRVPAGAYPVACLGVPAWARPARGFVRDVYLWRLGNPDPELRC